MVIMMVITAAQAPTFMILNLQQRMLGGLIFGWPVIQ
jgi:hypothetical protein